MDHLVINNGHTPVHLPTYKRMGELNPIELNMGTNEAVRENNVGELDINDLIALTERALESDTVSNWESFTRKYCEIGRGILEDRRFN